MDSGVLFNLFLGALALLGWAVLIIFLIEFRGEVTVHAIYRTLVSSAKRQPEEKLDNNNNEVRNPAPGEDESESLGTRNGT